MNVRNFFFNLDKISLIINFLVSLLKLLFNMGPLLIKISLKYINFASNVMFLFEQFFDSIKIFKSTKAIPFRSMFYVIGYGFKMNDDYFPLLKEIYRNYNKESDDTDMKDLKFKMIFEDTNIMRRYMKMFEDVFQVQIKGIQEII